MPLDPKKLEPSELVARVLAEGEPASKVVDFPRRRKDGSSVERVLVTTISDADEIVALARARTELSKALEYSAEKSDDDMLHNLRVRHLLAVACRRADDPRKPFFEHGAPEVMQFSSRELSQLWLAYLEVVEQDWPALRVTSGAELDLYLAKMREGVDAFPFSLFSRGKLETFCASAAMRCNELADEVEALRSEIDSLRGGAPSGTGSSGSP